MAFGAAKRFVVVVGTACVLGGAMCAVANAAENESKPAPKSDEKPRATEPARLDAPSSAAPLKPAQPLKPTSGVRPASNTAAPGAPAAKLSGTLDDAPAAPKSDPKVEGSSKPDGQPKPSPAASAQAPTKEVAPAGKLTLRYRWDANQVIHFDVVHQVTITTQKNQTVETAKNESQTRKHYRVVSVDSDGSALLEIVIDRVKMSAQFDENDPLTFDSESKDAPPRQFLGVKESIGKPMGKVKFSTAGELLDAVRLNAPAGAKSATPDNDPSNNFLIQLPKEPVSVGQTWTDKFDVKVVVSQGLTRNVTIQRKHELASVEGGRATIKSMSYVLTPISDPSINGQLIQRTPTGTTVFDIEKGQIVSRETKVDKTEIGVLGDNSSMRAVGAHVEKLVSRDDEKSAAAPVRTAADPEKNSPK